MINEILEKIGLKYEDLNASERETLFSWSEALSKSQISIESVKGYIKSMRDSIEQELTKVSFNTKQDLLLKARLRNYMLLEAYLSTPEKAKEALDRAVAGLVSKKK
jgi:hypothetical protein